MKRIALLWLFAVGSWGQARPMEVWPHKVNVEMREGVFYVTPAGGSEDQLAVLSDSAGFQNGSIELELSGQPAVAAGEGARGFVGVAFRVAADVSRFECFYLRPTNGRADDQVRRNHSSQYISF